MDHIRSSDGSELPLCVQRTIEDLTAKVSALTAENANLKLELSIQSTLSKAKDEHYSKLRRAKVGAAIIPTRSNGT